MSASATVVQCAAVRSERSMCAPICRRMTESGSPGGSAEAGRASTWASTSRLVTRPPRPLPETSDRSTACSAAIRRTTGDAPGERAVPAPASRPPFCVAAPVPASAVSMRASTAPTATTSPAAARISLTRPLAGAGTSASILSVDISSSVSSRSTRSPTALCHSTTVPSATDTPICGMVTSTVPPTPDSTDALTSARRLGAACDSVVEELSTCSLDILDLG